MKHIKFGILNILVALSLSGCVAELMVMGTAVSVAATAQEVEEDHDGNVWDYVKDKYNSLKSYAERKMN
ncbi:MAG: hypothetical protein RBR23_09450 [Arcobacteraceae bacterium]|jgi:hypothetical protein|nr:hypothetical protein [Arcobacteraceae bacterium]